MNNLHTEAGMMFEYNNGDVFLVFWNLAYDFEDGTAGLLLAWHKFHFIRHPRERSYDQIQTEPELGFEYLNRIRNLVPSLVAEKTPGDSVYDLSVVLEACKRSYQYE